MGQLTQSYYSADIIDGGGSFHLVIKYILCNFYHFHPQMDITVQIALLSNVFE